MMVMVTEQTVVFQASGYVVSVLVEIESPRTTPSPGAVRSQAKGRPPRPVSGL
jgi:hypothetical protein